jgi:hypothetical protein
MVKDRLVTEMRTIRRALTWLRDSLPFYSARDCARAWLAGQEYAKRQIGVVRDGNGKFTRISQ